MERKNRIERVSEETKAAIVKNSVQALKREPAKTAAEMQKQFVAPIVNGDGKPSALNEVDRVALQAEMAMDEILAIAQSAIDAILSRVTAYEGRTGENSTAIENLRAAQTNMSTNMTSLRQQLSRDVQTLAENAAQTNTRLAEVEALAKGASVPIDYDTYAEMVANLNAAPREKYVKGNDIRVVTLDVPDVWISAIADEYIEYQYNTDEDIVAALATGRFQVGHYVLSPLEGHKDYLKNYKTKAEHTADVQALLSLLPTIER